MNVFDDVRGFVQNIGYHPQAIGQVQVLLIEARNLPNKDFFSRSDPFVHMEMNGVSHRSSVINNNANPVWNQTFQFPIVNPNVDILHVQVSDHDTFSRNDTIGSAEVPIGGGIPGMPRDVWVPLQKHPNASIHLQITLPQNLLGMNVQGGMGMSQQPYGVHGGMVPPQQPYTMPSQQLYSTQSGMMPPQQPYAMPPQQPYAMPPQQPYAMPPQQPYGVQGGMVPPQQPYAMPSQQLYGTQSGMMPLQQPYGMPPQQPYSVPQQHSPYPSQMGAYPPPIGGYPMGMTEKERKKWEKKQKKKFEKKHKHQHF
jgi:hypothetical protein